MADKSKNKGSSFERLVARLCDNWYGVAPGTFRRTHHTGSWWRFSDVYTTNLRLTGHVPFCIECKHHRSYNPLTVLKDNKNDLLLGWWKQCVDQYRECKQAAIEAGEPKEITDNLYPLLFFRLNNFPVMVAVSDDILSLLHLSRYNHSNSPLPIPAIRLWCDKVYLTIFTFEAFSKVYGKYDPET